MHTARTPPPLYPVLDAAIENVCGEIHQQETQGKKAKDASIIERKVLGLR